MTITAASLLSDKPSEIEVERVDALWAGFNSTTQFLLALKQVMINRDTMPNELAALEKFLPVLARVEANDLNALIKACSQEPITQRAVPK